MGEMDNAVVLVRRIGAPGSDVFNAWTDPAILCRWLAPGENVVVAAETDLRIGGNYRIEFRGPDGATHEFKGSYCELEPPNRIRKTWHYAGPIDFLCGSESIVEVDIRELGPAETEYTLTHRQIRSKAERDAYGADWPSCMQKLGAVFGKESPSRFYSESHRALQDRSDSRRMADFMENQLVHAAFAEDEKAFIESRDMFFLSTIDPFGRPTVSHKGGPAGFVTVAGPSTLLFPSYDGNGMHYSLGNIMSIPNIGMLFIDFETPNRLRVQGTATLSFEPSLLENYPGAECVVSVAVEEIWLNCSRYIHAYKKVGPSQYTPEKAKEPRLPAWKRIDAVQEALPAKDQGKAEAHGGKITVEEFMEKVAKGDS